jgi:hypothetical protein
MLALTLLGRIPVLGALVVFAAVLAGLGAIVLVVRSRTTPSTPPPAATA